MAKKQSRRISNWSEYNKAMVNRGSLKEQTAFAIRLLYLFRNK